MNNYYPLKTLDEVFEELMDVIARDTGNMRETVKVILPRQVRDQYELKWQAKETIVLANQILKNTHITRVTTSGGQIDLYTSDEYEVKKK